MNRISKHIKVSFPVLAAGFCALFVIVTAAAPKQVAAQIGEAQACGETSPGFLDFPTWYKYLNPQLGPNGCELDSLRTGEGEIDFYYFLKIALAIFEIVLRIAGLAAVGFVIFGGFQYLVSRGEPDKIAGAQTTIINALVGLGIAIVSVAIVNLVGSTLR